MIQVKLPEGTVVQMTVEQLNELLSGSRTADTAIEQPKAVSAVVPAAASKPIEVEKAKPGRITEADVNKADVIEWAASRGRNVQRVSKNLVQEYLDYMNADEVEADPIEDIRTFRAEVEAADDDLGGGAADDDLGVDADEDDLFDSAPEVTIADIRKAVRAAIDANKKKEAANIVEKYAATRKVSDIPESKFGAALAELEAIL